MATSSTMTSEPASSGVHRATGREREEWFALLDRWGAAGRPFREIADYLKTEHDLSHWWAQKLIVEYEQARGLRPAGIRPGGTFSVTASKTVNVPVARLFDAFVDARLRRRWLPDAKMRKRTAEQGRSARFDWDSGDTHLGATFIAQGKGKSQVGVEHSLLPNSKAAEKMKAHWRERLTALKELLEKGS
jgi:uncharacterized protein YndB with AHSA1/START domain